MHRHLTLYGIASLLVIGLTVGCSSPSTTSTPTPSEPAAANSSAPANAKTTVYAEDGIAIRGTDPVAYFQQQQPIRGNAEFTYEWMGATWQFASAENRDLFASNPERYAPQYGGYCAWAVSQNTTAPIDPNAWAIVDNKLYLNVSPQIQERWQQDAAGNIAKADENWPEVLNN